MTDKMRASVTYDDNYDRRKKNRAREGFSSDGLPWLTRGLHPTCQHRGARTVRRLFDGPSHRYYTSAKHSTHNFPSLQPARRDDRSARNVHGRKKGGGTKKKERRNSLGHALDTARTTHDTSTAKDDDGFGPVGVATDTDANTTVRRHGQDITVIVMIAPRAAAIGIAIENTIAIDVFFIDQCFLAFGGGRG